MAKDDFFTATTTWTAVQVAAVDIVNGTFTMYGIGPGLVQFIQSDEGAPLQSEERGVSIESRGQNNKYALGATEKLYCRTIEGTTTFMIVLS